MIRARLNNSSFWGIWRTSHKEIVSWVYWVVELNNRRVITSWRLSHESSKSWPPRYYTDTSWNAYGINQGTKENESQSDPHLEAGLLRSQKTQNSGPKDDQDVFTGVHEEVIYCSLKTSSGKQKKKRSTSQLKLNGENTLLRLKQTNFCCPFSNWQITTVLQNFHNNINRISKLPKPLTTTMPTFDGKSEKFELFKDLFRTSLKVHNQLTEDYRINFSHFLMRGGGKKRFRHLKTVMARPKRSWERF